MAKHHPGKNLGNFLHPKKTNPMAVRMKPHAAPVAQTKMAQPKIPVAPKPSKSKIGRRNG